MNKVLFYLKKKKLLLLLLLLLLLFVIMTKAKIKNSNELRKFTPKETGIKET